MLFINSVYLHVIVWPHFDNVLVVGQDPVPVNCDNLLSFERAVGEVEEAVDYVKEPIRNI